MAAYAGAAKAAVAARSPIFKDFIGLSRVHGIAAGRFVVINAKIEFEQREIADCLLVKHFLHLKVKF
ncbi:hypothetical protein GCM10009077_38290 [Roseibium denhamense]